MKIRKEIGINGEERYYAMSENGGFALVEKLVLKIAESKLFSGVDHIEVVGSELTRWDEPNSDILWMKDGDYSKSDVAKLLKSENVDEMDKATVSGEYNGKKYSIEFKTRWSKNNGGEAPVIIRFKPADKETIKALLGELGYSAG